MNNSKSKSANTVGTFELVAQQTYESQLATLLVTFD